MTGSFGAGASSTRRYVLLDKGADARPSVLSTDQVQGASLAEVTGEWVIVFIPQDAQPKVINIRDVDAVI